MSLNEDQIKKRLTSMFYNLLRDHILPADLQKIIHDEERTMWGRGPVTDKKLTDASIGYSNPYLQDYAMDIANNILGHGTKVKKQTYPPRPL